MTQPAIAITQDGKTARVRRVCGCTSIHTIKPGQGGNFHQTPANKKRLAMIATCMCRDCRPLALAAIPAAIWHR